MTSANQSPENAEPVERFQPTSGYVVGYCTLAAIAVLVGYLLFADRSLTGLRIGTGAVLFGVVTWLTQLRPRATAYADSLHIINSVRDVVVPFVAIDEVEVTRVLTIRAGERRYICTGIGASPRKQAKAGSGRGQGHATSAVSHQEAAAYAAFVRSRINGLAQDAKRRAADAGTSDARPQPVWAWGPLLALLGAGAAFVVSLAL